jgi:predicted transcriptional regulator
MKHALITPTDLKPKPTDDEQVVASLLAEYWKTDIKFIKRGSNTTPDILALATNQYWEIKHIRGNGKYTISDNLRKAKKQSKNIIIALSRTNMHPKIAENRIKFFLKNNPTGIKKVILITKSRKIIDI